MEAPHVVIVRRTGTSWQAELPFAGTLLQARSLAALDRQVRKRLANQVMAYDFRTGNEELDCLVRRLRITRAAARCYEGRMRRLVNDVMLLQSGLSQRDVGILVRLSHQRVYQLQARQRELYKQLGGHGQE